MTAALIDGKALAARVRTEVARRNAAFLERTGRPAGLVVVRVGDDPASEIYVRGKRKAAIEAGLLTEEHHLPESTTEAELLNHVAELNTRDEIDGVLVQLPIPKHIHADAIIGALDPKKDVDGFHPVNAGNLSTGRPGTRPCTPLGCLRMIDEAGVALEGRHAVVVGRSNIVGKPVALMLLERGATVTICHSKTKNLGEVVSGADVLVVAVGKANLIQGDWIRPGATVIDVGMNRLPDGKLQGDVHFEGARQRAAFITPVPGGVGPMTIAMLLSNAVDCAERRTR